MEPTRNMRKVLEGIVVKCSVDKMCTVEVSSNAVHPMYKKNVRRTTKFLVDDPQNSAALNDVVEIMSCRPISKNKKWRFSKIVKKGVVIDSVKDEGVV